MSAIASSGVWVRLNVEWDGAAGGVGMYRARGVSEFLLAIASSVLRPERVAPDRHRQPKQRAGTV
jgi:hypothetical protein